MYDVIFEQARNHHLVTIGFLKALKNSLPWDEAFKIASEGFACYMVEYYEHVLGDTEANSQERFNMFRKHYAMLAEKSEYLDIVSSNTKELRIQFNRCPFYELLKAYGLVEFSQSFCMSDYRFTEKVLPGVNFSRTKEISNGDKYCDHAWRKI